MLTPLFVVSPQSEGSLKEQKDPSGSVIADATNKNISLKRFTWHTGCSLECSYSETAGQQTRLQMLYGRENKICACAPNKQIVHSRSF